MNILLDSELNATVSIGGSSASSSVVVIGTDNADTSTDNTDTNTDGTDTGTDGSDTGTDGTDTGTDGSDTGTDTGTDGSDTGTDGTDTGTDGSDTETDGTDTGTDGSDTGTDGTDPVPEVDDQTGTDVNLDVGNTDMPAGDMGINADMGSTVKTPLLANWPAVIGISGATILLGLIIGFLLAKKRIKKGIELYED